MARGDPKLVLYGPTKKHGARVKKGFKEFRWYIRHKAADIATGCGLSERDAAGLALSDYIKKGNTKPDEMALGQAVRIYTASLSDHSTKESLRFCSRHLFAALGVNSLCSSLDKARLEGYHRDRLAEGASHWTVHLELSQLRNSISHATKGEIKTWCPPQPSPAGRAISRKQVANLIKGRRKLQQPLARFNAALFALITFYSCQRKEAVRGLAWRPIKGFGLVDLDAGIIDFRRYGEPENKKRRAVQPIPRQLRIFLRIARVRTKTFVFEGRRGTRVSSSSIKDYYRVMRAAAKLDHVRGHDLIHTGLTLRARSTPQHVLSKFARKSPKTLNAVYLHVELEEMLEAADSAPGKRKAK